MGPGRIGFGGNFDPCGDRDRGAEIRGNGRPYGRHGLGQAKGV